MIASLTVSIIIITIIVIITHVGVKEDDIIYLTPDMINETILI